MDIGKIAINSIAKMDDISSFVIKYEIKNTRNAVNELNNMLKVTAEA